MEGLIVLVVMVTTLWGVPKFFANRGRAEFQRMLSEAEKRAVRP
jgi:hypothetical protein